MRFELTKTLIDNILFSMEDQNSEFLLYTAEAMVVCTENDEFYDAEAAEADDGRYISLPDWGPAEGFLLMERFAAGLHNPAAREELSAALDGYIQNGDLVLLKGSRGSALEQLTGILAGNAAERAGGDA